MVNYFLVGMFGVASSFVEQFGVEKIVVEILEPVVFNYRVEPPAVNKCCDISE